MKYILILCVGLLSFIGYSQSVEGMWNTYDDDSGELLSEVKVYIKDGKLYGKVIKQHSSGENNKYEKCEKCTDYRKGKPVEGMLIMSGLKKDGDKWEGDEVLLDPESGKEYDSEVWLENSNTLAVRGYLGWLYETKYWKRK